MKLSALLKGIETQSAFEDVEIERVTDKSEEITKNSLFVCIDGNRCDGHSLASEAIKKGASAVITGRDLKIEKQIIVSDTRKAFSLIASAFYGNPANNLKLIGVTGTNGKTSTSFFIKEILNTLSVKCGIIGTVKNDCGDGEEESVLTTPEPMELQRLLRESVDSGCEYCVMEVSSQALSQSRVEGLRFAVGILTNITPEHLDYHGDMESYINAKLSLFKMTDKAIINIDDETVKSVCDKIECPVLTVSAVSDRADYTAKNIVCDENGAEYLFVGMDCIERVKIPVPGSFTVYNSLCAISALINLGFSVSDVASAAKRITPVKGRAEKVDIPKDFTVMIDYAHTPDGLENILNCIKTFAKGRVITVFGCGGDRDRTKRPVMGKVAGRLSDVAIVTSDNPRTENPLLIINDILGGMEKTQAKLAVIENRRQAIEFALRKARPGDVVLLAGKGHEDYQIIGTEKIHFDEREIVKDFFKA
ncbi:MAG: UDP-N-acetylmuramoyl-L-alanyl-D-glutamate--2,6-diaminopimelate ligase [Candidatus Fimenecus sp.]